MPKNKQNLIIVAMIVGVALVVILLLIFIRGGHQLEEATENNITETDASIEESAVTDNVGSDVSLEDSSDADENLRAISSRADDIALIIQAWGESFLEENSGGFELDELGLEHYDSEDILYDSVSIPQLSDQNQRSIEEHAENLGIEYYVSDFTTSAHDVLLQANLMPGGSNEDKIYIWSEAGCTDNLVSGYRTATGRGWAIAFVYASEDGLIACRQIEFYKGCSIVESFYMSEIEVSWLSGELGGSKSMICLTEPEESES